MYRPSPLCACRVARSRPRTKQPNIAQLGYHASLTPRACREGSDFARASRRAPLGHPAPRFDEEAFCKRCVWRHVGGVPPVLPAEVLPLPDHLSSSLKPSDGPLERRRPPSLRGASGPQLGAPPRRAPGGPLDAQLQPEPHAGRIIPRKPNARLSPAPGAAFDRARVPGAQRPGDTGRSAPEKRTEGLAGKTWFRRGWLGPVPGEPV